MKLEINGLYSVTAVNKDCVREPQGEAELVGFRRGVAEFHGVSGEVVRSILMIQQGDRWIEVFEEEDQSGVVYPVRDTCFILKPTKGGHDEQQE